MYKMKMRAKSDAGNGHIGSTMIIMFILFHSRSLINRRSIWIEMSLHGNYTLVLQCHYTIIALRLLLYCIAFSLRLYWKAVVLFWSKHYHCIAYESPPHYHFIGASIIFALLWHWHALEQALPFHCSWISVTLL